jgi:hypothetical protein
LDVHSYNQDECRVPGKDANTRVDLNQAPTQGCQCEDQAKYSETPVQPGMGVEPFAALLDDIEIREHETGRKVGTPSASVPVYDKAECVVSETLPGGFDLANNNYAK